uniref:Transient receptor potential cation channel subfamily M member 3 n=1 Tax=Plectus sambesii TaxID=2011161 RepID=A0A914WJN1_9BILA
MDRIVSRKPTTQDFWYFGTPGWGQNAPPGPPPDTDKNHLNANDWTDMINVIQGLDVAPSNLKEHQRSLSCTSMRSLKDVGKSWIERTFQKRECIKFIPMSNDPTKCGCGRQQNVHPATAVNPPNPTNSTDQNEINSDQNMEKWSISRHTIAESTDAFGTIEFQGGPHPFKAQYARVAFDSDPADLIFLFDRIWKMQPPKLVITVHGGIDNFDLQPKLARAFQDGLMKAATTAGAWIITSGVNAGVVRHLAAALEANASGSHGRTPLVTIGIAPWGLLKKRDCFLGRDATVAYHSHAFSPKGPLVVLDDRHSYYVFVDNGTAGRYGAETLLRQRLEEYLAQKQLMEGSTRKVPVVGIIVEGGTCAIRAVLDYVTNVPPIPVVVCEGSGRASDLIAFAHRYVQDNGNLPDAVKPQLLSLVERAFKYNKTKADKAMRELMLCVQMHSLVTVFRLGENHPQQDVDHAILTALLKGQNLAGPDQLALTLAWNRVDIAQSDVFVLGQEWPSATLHSAMMDALINDRVDFVRLLLKNGVSMHKFLTFERLEELYNTDRGPPNTLYYVVRRAVKGAESYRYTLPDIGVAIEKLTGSACQSAYTSRTFRAKYNAYKEMRKRMPRPPSHVRSTSVVDFNSDTDSNELTWTRSRALRHHMNWRSATKNENRVSSQSYSYVQEAMDRGNDDEMPFDDESPSIKRDFDFPFGDLLLWAVLTKRHQMALCMWQHGEEAMAKALVACMLYHSLSGEASNDYLEIDLHNEFKKYSEEFGRLSVDLLDQCHQQDESATLQLLTYDLKNWGGQTCLSLAVIARNKAFVAHPCCQILICDLWNGGLRMRSQPNLKVLIGLLCPPSILFLEFKSLEELQLQPQSASEHAADVEVDDESRASELGWNGKDNKAYKADGEEMKLKEKKRSPSARVSIKKVGVPRFVISNDEGDHYSLGGTALSESDLQKPDNGSISIRRKSSFIMPRIRRSLHWKQKLYEFYMAPITSYWTWSLSYLVFVCAFTYVLLIDLPVTPTVIEWLLVAYVIVFALERCRMLILSEPRSFRQRLKAFFSRPANLLTTFAVIFFFVGFFCRMHPDYRHSYGRVMLVLSIVAWQLKMFEYLNVHKAFGPNIYIAALMLQSTMTIMVLLTVGILVFGTIKQTIHHPHEEFDWALVSKLFLVPYLMLYGELFTEDIDGCYDLDHHGCVPGHWIPVIFMVIYLLMAYVLILNLLIAIFNNIFSEKNAISQQVWLIGRYASVMEYENTSFLPPPFTIISHLYMLIKFLRIRLFANGKTAANRQSENIFDFSLKLFLNEKQQKKLYAFEEDCIELLMRNKTNFQNTSSDQVIRRTAERVENISAKINDMMTAEAALRNEIREKDAQLDTMQRNQREMVDILYQLSYNLSTLTEATSHPNVTRRCSDQGALTPAIFSRKPSTHFTNTNTAVAPSPPPPLTAPSCVNDEAPTMSSADADDSPNEISDTQVNRESNTPSPKMRKFHIVVVEDSLKDCESSSESDDESSDKSSPKKTVDVAPPIPTILSTRCNSTTGEQSNASLEKLAFPVSALSLQRALIEQVPLDRYPNRSSMPNLVSAARPQSLKERRSQNFYDDSSIMNHGIVSLPTISGSLALTPISNEDARSPSPYLASSQPEHEVERKVTFANS